MEKSRGKRATNSDCCVRGWHRASDGKMVRTLSAYRYTEDGDERWFVLRLKDNDPRPRGIFYKNTSFSTVDTLAGLPFCQWFENVYTAVEDCQS